jgi:hypothetical protein
MAAEVMVATHPGQLFRAGPGEATCPFGMLGLSFAVAAIPGRDHPSAALPPEATLKAYSRMLGEPMPDLP